MAKKSKRSKKAEAQQQSSMVVYRGPIGVGSGLYPQSVRIPLKQRYNVSAAQAGYIETYINTSFAFSANEFGNYAGIFKEYRVLGLQYQYVPWYDASGYVGTAVSYSVGSMAPYHGSPLATQGAVVASSDQTVLQLDGSKRWHPARDLTVEWRMNDVEEAQYYNTNQSYSSGGIYGVVPTATASRTYGTCFATILVEFKGRT